jgi:outer membrane protein assembly factor BamE (lipoprotein component of BamABCDE complex)
MSNLTIDQNNDNWHPRSRMSTEPGETGEALPDWASVTPQRRARFTMIDLSMERNRNKIARCMLAAMAGLALLSSCSSTGPSGNGASATAASPQASGNDSVPPYRGETRDQVLAQYDEPDQVFQSQSGETWVYFFGKAKQFIPFYGPFAEQRVLAIHFDPYGRVVGWEGRSNRS